MKQPKLVTKSEVLKHISFDNEFYNFYQNISVLMFVTIQNTRVFDKLTNVGPRLPQTHSFYNDCCTFMSVCFKHISFYNDLCMPFDQDQTQTHLSPKTQVFTMNYALFCKNAKFSNDL